MDLKKRLATAIATGAIIVNAFTPLAFADTTIQLSGNGAFSNNTANVTLNQSQSVVQNNSANITNNVDVNASTGKNDANFNTGGDVSIDTGNANVGVEVKNLVNKNVAEVDCCDTGDTHVLIKGNGAHSDNDVDLNVSNSTQVFQDNNADVRNWVDADAKTGKNDASFNTNGDVRITTGDADVKVDLTTVANANIARLSNDNGSSGDLSLRILDNGAFSDNDIDLDVDKSVAVVQNNWADVRNWVDADAKTGKNDANFNTGGDVTIETGDANVDVDVDNLVNFNWADLDCGCLFGDLLAKIDGNGAFSDNNINASLSNDDNTTDATQDNWADVRNWVDEDAKTGKNDASHNTLGDPNGDPTIETGDADANVRVSNVANKNIFSSLGDLSLPDFDLEFDLGDLLSWLHHS